MCRFFDHSIDAHVTKDRWHRSVTAFNDEGICALRRNPPLVLILAYIHRSSRNVTSERARHTSRVALVVSEAAKREKGIGADGGDASANTRDLALHDLADGATVAERLVRVDSSDRELARRICIRMEMGVRLCLRGGSAPLCLSCSGWAQGRQSTGRQRRGWPCHRAA